MLLSILREDEGFRIRRVRRCESADTDDNFCSIDQRHDASLIRSTDETEVREFSRDLSDQSMRSRDVSESDEVLEERDQKHRLDSDTLVCLRFSCIVTKLDEVIFELLFSRLSVLRSRFCRSQDSVLIVSH